MGRHARKDRLIYDCKPDGHRANYVSVIADLIDGEPLVAPVGAAWWRLLFTRQLLLTTVETAPRIYALILIVRALLGRRSAAIFLRAHLGIDGRDRGSRLRSVVLAILTHLPRLSLFSIVSMSGTRYASAFKTIADPEFWDVAHLGTSRSTTPLSEHALAFAAGRPILAFAGYVEAGRGVNFLADLACAGVDPAIVVCGTVLDDADAAVRRMLGAGAMVEGRFLSDAELLSLIDVATYVWCCFPPERDMSSGLFGRAMQLGAVPIVRRGSVLDAMAERLTPAIVLDYPNIDAAKAALSEPPKGKQAFDGADRLRDDARASLLAAFH